MAGSASGRLHPVAPSGSSKPHKLDQRLQPDVISELLAEYEAGMPTTQLAALFDLSKGAVLTLLHEAGVSMRRQPLTDKELADARQLYESGLSLVAVGERIGRHHTTVHLSLRRAGVVMRARQGGRRAPEG
jgi:Helix-turn-helix domain